RDDRAAPRLLVQPQPLLVDLGPGLAVDGLALAPARGGGDPHVGGEAVPVRVDGPLAVRPTAHGQSASASAARLATYSSTHAGRMRRDPPSLSERRSPEMHIIRTFVGP